MPPEPAPKGFLVTAVCLIGLVALSIDTVLPGLGALAADLGVADGNHRQLVVTAFLLGLAAGQMLYGPLSDSIGRKPAILAGLGLFTAGSILSAAAPTFEIMLLGRALQGFGVAGPRIVTVAMIRDLYEGAAMARLMSLIMTVFIMVPVFAPTIGQAILTVGSWRAIFVVVLCLGWVGGLRLALLQPETLRVPRPLRPTRVLRSAAGVLAHRQSMAVTLAGAAVYGALMGYVTSSQQLYAEVYDARALYPALFGATALFLGAAAFANSRLVARFPLTAICRAATGAVAVWALLWLGAVLATGRDPSLVLWVAFTGPALFALGLTFGNLNAIALQPFGADAGVAAAVVATVTTVGSLVFATSIGWLYDGSTVPVIAGFAVLGSAAFACLAAAPRQAVSPPVAPAPASAP